MWWGSVDGCSSFGVTLMVMMMMMMMMIDDDDDGVWCGGAV